MYASSINNDVNEDFKGESKGKEHLGRPLATPHSSVEEVLISLSHGIIGLKLGHSSWSIRFVRFRGKKELICHRKLGHNGASCYIYVWHWHEGMVVNNVYIKWHPYMEKMIGVWALLYILTCFLDDFFFFPADSKLVKHPLTTKMDDKY